jgi:hypothetical protein
VSLERTACLAVWFEDSGAYSVRFPFPRGKGLGVRFLFFGRDFRAVNIRKGALRDVETETGFACAKLSEILPSARVARFVRMTEELRVDRFGRDAQKN